MFFRSEYVYEYTVEGQVTVVHSGRDKMQYAALVKEVASWEVLMLDSSLDVVKLHIGEYLKSASPLCGTYVASLRKIGMYLIPEDR